MRQHCLRQIENITKSKDKNGKLSADKQIQLQGLMALLDTMPDKQVTTKGPFDMNESVNDNGSASVAPTPTVLERQPQSVLGSVS